MTPQTLLLIPGDGIAVEIFEAIRPLVNRISERLGLATQWGQAGYGCFQARGRTIDEALLASASACDAVLFGAEDSEGYLGMPPDQRPASALLQLRRAVGGYANIRPIRAWPMLAHMSPLRETVVRNTDLVIVRELLGGLYFGQPRGIEQRPDGSHRAVDTMVYETAEIERVAHIAFALARQRSGRLCSVDKANVLACSHLWRETVNRVALDHPDVALSHMYVDNCALQIVRRPAQFDVILTDNTFGDILSDGGAVIAGSIGLLPSACLGAPRAGQRHRGLYEPIHGSAPDIAGQGLANPVGTLLSLAMALRHSLGHPAAAHALEQAVEQALGSGCATPDLGGSASTQAFAAAVTDSLVL